MAGLGQSGVDVPIVGAILDASMDVGDVVAVLQGKIPSLVHSLVGHLSVIWVRWHEGLIGFGGYCPSKVVVVLLVRQVPLIVSSIRRSCATEGLELVLDQLHVPSQAVGAHGCTRGLWSQIIRAVHPIASHAATAASFGTQA